MNLHRNRMASTIASLLTCSMLAACGGGGGGGMVRSSAPPVNPPPAGTPPPPPPAPAMNETFCPAPIVSDCVPDLPYTLTFDENQMKGGRDSDFSLRIRENFLTLWGDYRFGAGTTIEEDGALIVDGLLRSNALVQHGGALWLRGTLRGDLTNAGRVLVGQTKLGPQSWATDNRSRIEGNFTQQAGTLSVTVGMPLQVTGQAMIEGGTLELRSPVTSSGSLILPSPASHPILHADGGVFGAFTNWTSPGLFIEGGLRYGSNDVWFDLSRISVQAAMAAQGFGGITLASAGNFDRALAIADGFASQPSSPNAAQSRFLQSASRLLWLGDAQQAARSLDSLAGSLHVDAMHALAQDDALARGIGARTLTLQPGMQAGAWSHVRGDNTIGGFDQWLSPRLLAGAMASRGRAASGDGFDGQVQHDSPQAALYLRWFGDDGWYAGGSAGHAQHALVLDRRIDLADGKQWGAHAQRRLGIASLDAEAGRRFAFAGTTVAPYLWLGADVLRSEHALEQGQTGFELALQANTQASLDAGVGMRLGKHWRFGESGWLALDADARYRQRLARSGDPLRAAFIGVPDVWFDLPGHDGGNSAWLDLGLRGGFGRGWGWSLGHAGALTGDSRDRRWLLGLQRAY